MVENGVERFVSDIRLGSYRKNPFMGFFEIFVFFSVYFFMVFTPNGKKRKDGFSKGMFYTNFFHKNVENF